MHDAYLRQSPLAHLHLEACARSDETVTNATVVISERPHRCQIGIRGDAADPVFAEAVTKVLKVDLPVEPCTVTGDPEALHVLWLGPDEWLVVGRPDQQDKLVPSLTKALAHVHAAVWDVSDSRTTIHLTGSEARPLLCKGCAIDLHPREFGPGTCVSTHLAKAHVILHQTAYDEDTDTPAYDIYVHRSFAEYLWSWLMDAGREYGVKVVHE